MILEFHLGNYRSFQKLQTLQLQAAPIRSRYPWVDAGSVAQPEAGIQALRAKAILGANESGKSNIGAGMAAMRTILLECLQNPEVLEQRIEPFRLDEDSAGQATFFQLNFLQDGIVFRYGFEADRQSIRSEWLFAKPVGQAKTRERYYFTREGMELQINEKRFAEADRITGRQQTPTLLRPNTLFLSVCAAFNGEIGQQILTFFREQITIISGLKFPPAYHKAVESLDFPPLKKRITDLLTSLDTGITRLEKTRLHFYAPANATVAERKRIEQLHTEKEPEDVVVYRKKFNDRGEMIGEEPLLLNYHESEGTRKLFELSVYLITTLETGGLLFVDEFDARLHPSLSRKLVEQFLSPENNPHNAQLVFVTHDSNLLDPKLLRRDQISFVNKDKFGVSEMYSLAEFKGVRKDASFEKDYLLGKYDAVPTNLNMLEEALQAYGIEKEEDGKED